MLGEAVGNYQIVGRLSEGGMGAVFRAQHALIGKAAAVKVLLPELSTNREIVQRFFNEARAATGIRHPGIVEIFDFGYTADGRAYIVMELLDGETLSKRLSRHGRLSEAEACPLIRQVAGALAAAHAKGVVHRDLKPDNIFVVPDPDMPGGERTKILDFGIAKLSDHGQTSHAKTRTGAVMGTPMYMSPEQCRGAGEVDHRSDLYSIGCILYELVTGRTPFVGEGAGEIIGAHVYLQPESPRRLAPEISSQLEALIMRLLAKEPSLRLQSAGELSQILGGAALTPGVSGVARTTAPVVALASATPVPTTLGGSAVETVAVTRSGVRTRGWMFGLGGAVVIAGIAIAIAVGSGGGTKPVATSAAPPPAPVEPRPEAAPKPEPPIVTPPSPAAAAARAPAPVPPPAAPVHITFDVKPENATLHDGDHVLDSKVVEIEAGAPPENIEVTAAGYKPQTIKIDGSKDALVRVVLEPERRPRDPGHAHGTHQGTGSGSGQAQRPLETDL